MWITESAPVGFQDHIQSVRTLALHDEGYQIIVNLGKLILSALGSRVHSNWSEFEAASHHVSPTLCWGNGSFWSFCKKLSALEHGLG